MQSLLEKVNATEIGNQCIVDINNFKNVLENRIIVDINLLSELGVFRNK